MITCDQKTLPGKFFSLMILLTLFIGSVGKVNAQITPVTQYPCDPRSTANGGICPAQCQFPVGTGTPPSLTGGVEKGCNCFDGNDNDGDGKIDAADISDCAQYFGLSFVGPGTSNCSLVPPGGNPFAGIGAPAESQQNTADTQSKVAAGDVTGDGVPESVITSKWNNEVRVINPNGTINASYNLSGKKSLFTGFTDVDGKIADPDRLLLEHEVLIVDIKRAANQLPDKKGEIFAIVSSRGGNPKTPPNGFYLLALTWTKPDPNGLVLLYDPVPLGTNRPGIFGVADMDGDGFAEIYLRDRIYAAETGKLLASDGSRTHLNTTNWDSDVTAAPVAVNVQGDTKMELVCGTKVFTIPSLTNRNPAAPSALTLVKDMNVDFPATKCFVKLMNDPVEYGVDTHSSTSVADIDRDGKIDVVISGALNSSIGRTAVFYWNIAKNKVDYVLTPSSAELGLAAADPNFANYSTGWIWGTGRVNIGDANGDGKSDFTFMAGNQLFCVTTNAADNMVTLWTQNQVNTAKIPLGYRSINDSRSGVLTATIYDFDNNGQPEMVYRDSQSLNVVDGATGANLLWSVVCQSHTYTEGPIIADVNGDGATDICVTCNTSNSFNINADIQQQALGQVRLYFTNGVTWLPTRKVWNQPGYFVVNINDNLTLPFPQLDQSTIFSNAPCPNGSPGPQRPMNVFLNQVPFLNANGCPVFPAPDLTFAGDNPNTPGVDSDGNGVFEPAIVVTPPICGNLDITVQIRYSNIGDIPITDAVPVSFFKGDPTIPGAATRLHNTIINITNLQVGQSILSSPIVFNGDGSTFNMYVALYNDGSVLPIPASGQTAKECSIQNNVYPVQVVPTPFTAQINKFQDNLKCLVTDPSTGELRARVFKGATEVFDFSPYAFQWYTGIGTTNPIPAGQGGQSANILGLDAGDYTLVVTNTQKNCSAAPVNMNVTTTITLPAITVTTTPQDQCNPPNGSITAQVTGGNTGFSFTWYTSTLTNLGITTSVASGLISGDYFVEVSRNGCKSPPFPATVVDLSVEPDAVPSVLQNVVDCLSPNSGSITAQAFLPGNPNPQNDSEYTFNWYFYNTATNTRGSILPAINGAAGTPTRTGLAAGSYQLELIRKSTQCVVTKPPIVVTNSTILPVASFTNVIQQTSCDPLNPNGSITAIGTAPTFSNPTDFTFEWFRGDNTLPANKIPIAGGPESVSGTKGEIINKVKGGGLYYTVKITTPKNCSATAKIIIPENVTVPVITLTPSPNSICDPTLGFNGLISQNTLVDPNAIAGDTYTYAWSKGATPIAGTSAPLTGLNGGFYSATITNNRLKCTSLPVTVEVINSQVLPVITSTNVPSTNCAGSPDNGSVTANTVTPSAPYTFKWYSGNTVNPGSELTPLNNPTITGLKGGLNYTVEVTIQSSGCKNTLTTTLPDNKQLPILTLTPSPNSICDPLLGFNGSITQNTLTDPNGSGDSYTYAWSTGNDMSNIITNQSSSTLSQKNGGFYTATVTNNRLKCTSVPVTVEIINNQVFPVITTSKVPSTNCAGGADNGQLTAATVTPSAPYTFKWYSGNVVNPGSELTPLNSATVSGLKGGLNYTVEITINSSGCKNTLTTLLPDNKQLPVLTLTPSPNSICDQLLGFNGSITQNTLTDPNGSGDSYTYAWSTGNDMSNIINNQSSSTLSQKNGGFYTATVTNNRLKCTSVPVTVEIINNQVFPVITTSNVPSTNCAGGADNGQLTAATVTPSAPYTFKWYSGNVVNPGSELTPLNSATVSGLKGGLNYTVEITINSSGCKNTLTTLLPDNKQLPVLTLTPVPTTICDPSKVLGGGTFDGQVNAIINNIPAGSTVNNYFFDWSVGTDGDGANNLIGLDVGTYSVTALHKITNCKSIVYSAQVTSAKTLPTIIMGQTPAEYCAGGNPDGIAKVLSVSPTGKNYDYRWFDGNSTSGSPGPTTLNTTSTTNDYKDVKGGINGISLFEYTVEVTILQTGCVNTATIGVDNDSKLPVVTLLPPIPNTNCSSNKNGKAALSTLSYRTPTLIGPPYTGFTFSWSPGGTVGPAPGDTYTNLPAGTYTLTVTNTADNCTSNPVPVTIVDDLFIPPIDVAVIDQTSCNVATPNGKLTATINETTLPGGGSAGVTAGYSFNWVDNVTSSATALNAIANLKGNQTYTITAIRNLTGCTNSQTIFLNETLTFPVVTVTPTPLTKCAPPNGELTASVIPAVGTGSYTYFWYDNDDAVNEDFVINNFDDNTSGANYKGLIPGNYTVVVVDNGTTCKSTQVIGTVVDNSPVFNPVVANTKVPTSCATNDGEMEASIQTFNLSFTGDATTERLTTSAAHGLSVGDKIILSRNGTNALPIPLNIDNIYFVESTPTATTLTLSATSGGPLINLTANGNGFIGDYGLITGYTFNWYESVPTGVNPILPINYFSNPPNFAALVAGPANSITYPSIPTGLYSLEVTDLATGCKTYVNHTLPFIGSHAVIRISKTNSTVCAPLPDNGSVTIQIEDPPAPPPGANYDIVLKQGASIISGPINNATQLIPYTLSNTLSAGTYIVEVEQNFGTNCVLKQDVTIGNDARDPVISLNGPIIDNTACDPAAFDGKIDLIVDKDPSDVTGPTTYDVTMAPAVTGSGFPIVNLPGGPLNVFSANKLGPANYTFQATDKNSGCVSDKSFTVLNNPVVTQFNTANIAITDAEYCLANLERSAKVIVNQLNIIGGGPESLDNYEFKWKNLSTNVVVFTAIGDATNTKSGGDEFINQVPAAIDGTVPAGTVWNGTYSIVATKKTDVAPHTPGYTGGIGCQSPPYNLTIDVNKITPQIVLTPTGDTSCDPLFFEGSIEVDVTTASGPGSGGTYAYTWNPTGASGQPANSTGNNGLSNIQLSINEGNYVLNATNEVTGCSSSLSTTLIKESPPVFTLNATSTNLTTCDLLNFNGKIDNLQVFIDGVGGNVPEFDYVWFKSDLLPASKVLDGQDITVLTDDQLTLATYPAITLDKYFVKAIRKSGGKGIGCESSAIRRDILDDRAYPTISFTTLSSTSCDNNFDGQITVNATTPGFAGANYLFDWNNLTLPSNTTITDATTISPAIFASEALGGPAGERIGPGDYDITVTNQVNGCAATDKVTLLKNTVPVEVFDTNSNPLTNCTNLTIPTNPNGSVEIRTGVNVGGIPTPLGQFSFGWTGNNGPYTGTTVTGLTNGDYFVTATKTSTTSPASGCASPPFKVTVEDNRRYPVINFTTISSTSCDTNFDGQITVNATTTGFVGATYLFDWDNLTLPPNTTITDATTVSPAIFASQALGGPVGERIGPGSYDITVTNQVNGCDATSKVTLLKNTVPVEVFDTNSNPLTNCTNPTIPTNPNGSVEIRTGVNVGGIPTPLGQFSFGWTGNNGPYTGTTVTGLTNGDYFVTATKTNTTSPASGCASPPFKVTVEDNRRYPVINFTTISSTSCDTNFDGQITVNATTTGFVGATYLFDWDNLTLPPNTTITDATTVSPAIFASQALGGPVGERIGPGSYDITVTNQVNGCVSSGNVTLLSSPQPLDILTVDKEDQKICLADGRITVTSLNSSTVGDYSYEWFRNNINTTPLTDAGNVTITTPTLTDTPILITDPAYPTMGAGTYFVVATKNTGLTPGSGCSTPPFRVDILDLHKDPKLDFTFTPNSSCNNLLANGIVLATASERDPAIDPTDPLLAFYNFNWTSSPTAIVPIKPSNNTNQINNALHGDYALTVNNTITGCSFSSGINVKLDLNISLPNIITVDTIEPTTCIGDGSAKVTGISIGGGPTLTGPAIDPPKFEYEWYVGTFPGAKDPNVNPLFAPLAAGKYFVRVKDLTTDCISAPTEVDLNDLNIIYPTIELNLTTPSISCDNSLVRTGVLRADITLDNSNPAFSNPNYTYEWFNNLNLTPPTIPPSPTITAAAFNSISGLTSGDYSLKVTNSKTGCASDAIYIVPDNSPQFTPVLTLSSSDRTKCVGQDGKVFAQVVINNDAAYKNAFAIYNFTADFFIGDKVSDPNLATLTPDIPDMPKDGGIPANPQKYSTLDTLAQGFYTVRVIDNNTGCEAVNAIEVKDGRILPVIEIKQENPNFNCDAAIADGQLSATVNETTNPGGGKKEAIAGYTFDWYTGATIPIGATPIVSDDNRLIGFLADDYSVRVTNNLTGCVSDKSEKIIDEKKTLDPPTALVIRDRTNCVIPNGWVTANVKGVTIAHTFNWYDGSAVKPASDFVGPDYFDRDIGPYTVTATDIITRCVSTPATVTVKDARVLPIVEVTSTPALCLTPTGVITLTLINNQEVTLTDITWFDDQTNAIVGRGPEVYELTAGSYNAQITTSESCEGTASIEIETEILSYNLVSVNGDSKNDVWIIDCLQNFPGNNVKVFNRSGVKVYEADGYDNNNVVFRGVGENGVYFLGDNLPDGTYFYIIDKRNGSKPITGYLELVR